MSRAPGVVALGVALCLLAAGFATPALYVPGVALVLLAVGTSAWVSLSARRCRVSRRLLQQAVEEGAGLLTIVTIEHGRLPFPGGQLVPCQGAEGASFGGPPPSRVGFEVTIARRGRHLLEPARLRIRDPLAMCVREAASPPSEVLVLPRVESLQARALGGSPGAGSHSSRGAESSGGEVDSLRPHRAGAPASRIHWPTLARTGVLMERRVSADADRRPLIVVDPRQPESEEALDMALRASASLCVHLATLGGCALLLPGARRAAAVEPDLRAWPPLHARLALLEADRASLFTARCTRAATVLWVTASASGPPAALARLSGDRYLVTPFPRGRGEIAFTVAGCSGQRLGGGARAEVA